MTTTTEGATASRVRLVYLPPSNQKKKKKKQAHSMVIKNDLMLNSSTRLIREYDVSCSSQSRMRIIHQASLTREYDGSCLGQCHM